MKRILMLCIVLSCASCTCNTPTSGQKIGRIVKMADEGMFSTTTEGELLRGGLTDGSGSMGGSFHFTIEKPSLKALADRFMESQTEVVMTYETPFIASAFRSESLPPHFVTGIKPANQ